MNRRSDERHTSVERRVTTRVTGLRQPGSVQGTPRGARSFRSPRRNLNALSQYMRTAATAPTSVMVAARRWGTSQLDVVTARDCRTQYWVWTPEIPERRRHVRERRRLSSLCTPQEGIRKLAPPSAGRGPYTHRCGGISWSSLRFRQTLGRLPTEPLPYSVIHTIGLSVR